MDQKRIVDLIFWSPLCLDPRLFFFLRVERRLVLLKLSWLCLLLFSKSYSSSWDFFSLVSDFYVISSLYDYLFNLFDAKLVLLSECDFKSFFRCFLFFEYGMYFIYSHVIYCNSSSGWSEYSNSISTICEIYYCCRSTILTILQWVASLGVKFTSFWLPSV